MKRQQQTQPEKGERYRLAITTIKKEEKQPQEEIQSKSDQQINPINKKRRKIEETEEYPSIQKEPTSNKETQENTEKKNQQQNWQEENDQLKTEIIMLKKKILTLKTKLRKSELLIEDLLNAEVTPKDQEDKL